MAGLDVSTRGWGFLPLVRFYQWLVRWVDDLFLKVEFNHAERKRREDKSWERLVQLRAEIRARDEAIRDLKQSLSEREALSEAMQGYAEAVVRYVDATMPWLLQPVQVESSLSIARSWLRQARLRPVPVNGWRRGFAPSKQEEAVVASLPLKLEPLTVTISQAITEWQTCMRAWREFRLEHDPLSIQGLLLSKPRSLLPGYEAYRGFVPNSSVVLSQLAYKSYIIRSEVAVPEPLQQALLGENVIRFDDIARGQRL